MMTSKIETCKMENTIELSRPMMNESLQSNLSSALSLLEPEILIAVEQHCHFLY